MRGIHFQLRAVAWPRFVAPSGFGLVELEGGLGAPLAGLLARGVVLRTVPLPRGEALRAGFGPSGMEKNLCLFDACRYAIPTDRRARLIHVGTKIRTEKQENFVKDFETPYIVQYEKPFASRSGLVCRFKRELLAQV